jgi:hypothetical protein
VSGPLNIAFSLSLARHSGESWNPVPSLDVIPRTRKVDFIFEVQSFVSPPHHANRTAGLGVVTRKSKELDSGFRRNDEQKGRARLARSAT